MIKLLLWVFAVTCFSCSIKNGSEQEVLATFDGDPIVFHDVDALIQPELYESLFNTYYARKLMAEDLIKEKLLLNEANKQKISKDSLVQQIIVGSSISLSQYVIQNNLDQGIPDSAFPGRLIPTDDAEGKKKLSKLYREFCVERFVTLEKGKHKIQVFLKPPLTPKIDLSEIQFHKLNSVNSNNVIWVFSDFNCARCKAFFSTLVSLKSRFGNSIEFRYTSLTDFPTESTQLAEFAGVNGKFWEACSAIFRNGDLRNSDVPRILETLQLDSENFMCYVANQQNGEIHKKNYEKLLALNRFQVTPTIVINDRIYYGDLSFSRLSEYIKNSINEAH
ncbi:thioredoxin domain-containing protein [Dyadobacter sp. 32]|uniref:thioredoxin domain-containing protein n=1 Tax=Dyadobacter sp. 32 TaxID=538966 RepID=UPI0011F0163E